ncbi:ChaN family lipoprotein [Pontibaca methylaminivorans]|uniref:Uncharacterized iron-regulated protein n=1 Tax=Pontibaca methylaminivorans TaxID=515897 RepID=A0A1R3WWN8_9RHOB|nr:ChaN family lipoprotein [Pontibaca methylaminivorans]SIT82946.1 Uncharacterized iron-regulated protein [Pontibaca methylaminivorans]
MRIPFVAALACLLFAGCAPRSLPLEVVDRAAGAEVVFLGESHDNPTHHARQADFAGALKPRAVVWEMLTAENAAQITPDLIADRAALESALDWEQRGWPDFAMYYPIFQAASAARHYGAELPREQARRAREAGIATAFGGEARDYGLDRALPASEQGAREALQQEAHCNALPERMLAPMVGIQRLRDAMLARAALRALRETGGPVVVITGNGHARKDWGAPAHIARVAPGVRVFSLGQTEGGQTEGGQTEDGQGAGSYDAVLDADAPARDDPCEAFRGMNPAPASVPSPAAAE